MDGPHVLFVSGEAYNSKTTQRERQAAVGDALEAGCAAPHPEQRRLLRLLNDPAGPLTDRAFTDCLKHLPEAFAHVSHMEASGAWSAETADGERRKLKAIEQMPRPLYRVSPKGRTVRVFGIGESLVTLKRDVRAVMLQGLYSADLASAQAAITAERWGVAVIRDFLSGGGSLWDAYAEGIGGGWKDAHKAGFYGLVFGGDVARLRWFMTEEGTETVPDHVIEAFEHHPFTVALLDAREAQLQHIGTDGGASDAFGDWQAVEAGRPPRKVLASVVQSWEFVTMQAVVTLAEEEARKDRPEFVLVGWLHDGVYLKPRRPNRPGVILGKIQAAVDAEAARLGFPTRFEVESVKANPSRPDVASDSKRVPARRLPAVERGESRTWPSIWPERSGSVSVGQNTEARPLPS